MESISDDCDPLSEEWDDILGVLVDDQDGGMSNCDFQPYKKLCTRKRKSNPDSDSRHVIALATEEELVKLGLDPKSEEAKLAKRKIRNRISAQTHRDNKNKQLSLLENEVDIKNRQIEELNREVLMLRMENEQLRQQLSLPVLPMGPMTGSDIFVSSGSFTPTGYASSSSGSRSPEHASIALPAFASHGLVGGTVLKSISFLCVACVVCLCGWSQVDMQTNSSIALPGRRLSTAADATPAELFLLAQNNTMHNLYLTRNEVLQVAEEVRNKPAPSPRNLRRRSSAGVSNNGSFSSALNYTLSAPIMRSLSASSSLSASYLSRDLIPFPVTKAPTEDWFSYQQRINALSSSQIFLQSGFALFDPAFQAIDINKRKVPSQWASKPATVKLASPVPLRALLPPTTVQVPISSPVKEMDVEEDKREGNPKNWPAVRQEHAVARLPSRPMRQQQPYVEEIYTEEAVKEALYSQAADLIAQSNIVTVTLPASAVKHGRSLQDSEAGTVDSILRMFNLTENATVGEAAHGLSVADAWLEMSVIVVGAKIGWNHHA